MGAHPDGNSDHHGPEHHGEDGQSPGPGNAVAEAGAGLHQDGLAGGFSHLFGKRLAAMVRAVCIPHLS